MNGGNSILQKKEPKIIQVDLVIWQATVPCWHIYKAKECINFSFKSLMAVIKILSCTIHAKSHD